MAKLIEHAAVECFEAPLLGRREVIGQREGGEVLEGLAHGLQAPLDLGGARRGGRRPGLGMQAAERVTHQRAAVRFIGSAIGLDDDQGIARLEAVPLDTRKERVLVLVRERAQLLRQRRSDRARAQLTRSGVG